MLYMMLRTYPFKHLLPANVAPEDGLSLIIEGVQHPDFRIPFPEGTPAVPRDLVERCLRVKPSERITIEVRNPC